MANATSSNLLLLNTSRLRSVSKADSNLYSLDKALLVIIELNINAFTNCVSDELLRYFE